MLSIIKTVAVIAAIASVLLLTGCKSDRVMPYRYGSVDEVKALFDAHHGEFDSLMEILDDESLFKTVYSKIFNTDVEDYTVLDKYVSGKDYGVIQSFCENYAPLCLKHRTICFDAGTKVDIFVCGDIGWREKEAFLASQEELGELTQLDGEWYMLVYSK